LDGKIQFRGVLKKMIVRFTGVNERLFFLTQRRKWSFRPNTTYSQYITMKIAEQMLNTFCHNS